MGCLGAVVVTPITDLGIVFFFSALSELGLGWGGRGYLGNWGII